jgi:Ran-binding protein 9/10
MANPYHRGTPNYISDPSISAGIAGGAQRTSYASVASGNVGLGNTGGSVPGIAHLLNSANDGPQDFASSAFASTRRGSDDDMSFTTGQRSSTDAERSGFIQSGAARQPWPGSHLQNFSRAFETFMGKEYMPEMNGNGSGNGSGHVPRLLKPSYLDGSLYYQKLEEVWKPRLLAQRETNANQSAGVAGLSSGNASSQIHSSKIATGSHRGMTYEVVEKAPQLTSSNDETTVTPLPSRWNKDDKYGGLEVLGVDGFEVKYTGHRQSGEREHEACSIRTDTHMPPQCGIYYFEVTVLNRKRDEYVTAAAFKLRPDGGMAHTYTVSSASSTTIAIGFSGKAVSLARVPGWEPESWGYHGDDGNIYAAQNIGKPYGQPFGPGDCIGCGVNFNTGTAFFTRNGRNLGSSPQNSVCVVPYAD